MSVESPSVAKEVKSFMVNGKGVEILIPLFGFNSVSMLNIDSKKVSERLVWGVKSGCQISLYGSAKNGGSVLLEPAEYLWEPCQVSIKNPKGIRPVRKRIALDGLALCAHKLSSGLQYDINNMSLPISPSALKSLVEDAVQRGNIGETPSSYKLVLVRSNDLRREAVPKPEDRWVCIGGHINFQSLEEGLPSINTLERMSNSPFREAVNDPRLEQIIEDIR